MKYDHPDQPALVYVTTHVERSPNATSYRRVGFLGRTFDTVLLHRSGTVPPAAGGDVAALRWRARHVPLIDGELFALWCLLQIGSVIRQRGRDVLIVTTYQPTILCIGFLAQLVFGLRWAADVFDHPRLVQESREHHSGRDVCRRVKMRLYGALSEKILRRADLVLCTLAPGALRDFGLQPERIRYFTNGTELSCIPVARHLTSPNQRFTVAYLGHVLRIRGLDTMLDAALSLFRAGLDVQWVLVGPSRRADRQWMETTLQSTGLSGSVVWTGERPHAEALALAGQCQICVYPFKRHVVTDYIFPIKLFEYMALGKPIVASDLPGVRMVLEDGQSALLVPPGDPAQLAAAVRRLYDDGDLRDSLGRAALKAVRSYVWDQVEAQVGVALNGLCGRRSGAAGGSR